MTERRLIIACAAALAAAVAVSGCGDPYGTIESVHPPLGHRRVETRQAAWMFSGGRVIEIVLERQWSLPGGEAAPDVEFVHLVVPDAAGRYPVSHPAVRVTRYVRAGREEFLYTADSGAVDVGFSWPGRERLAARLEAETHAVYPADAAAGAHRLEVRVGAPEDVVLAQGLLNRYADTIARLRGDAPAAAHPAASPRPAP
jgi:hypothetical protein